MFGEAAAALKVPVADVPARLAAVVKELKDLKKAKPAAATTSRSLDDLLAGAADVAGTRVVVADMGTGDANTMRQAIDLLRRKASPIAVLLGGAEGDKVTLVAGISKELEARGLSAGSWIRDVATVVGGKGGGRPDLAQAGGKLVAKLPEASTRLARRSRPCCLADARPAWPGRGASGFPGAAIAAARVLPGLRCSRAPPPLPERPGRSARRRSCRARTRPGPKS